MTDIPKGALIVVADGKGARLFQNSGDAQALKLKPAGEFGPADLHDDGPAGAGKPESSVRDDEEATFAKQLANELNRRALKNGFDALVLIADPTTLGQMRPLLHKEVQKRIVAEKAKTHTGASLAELEKALS